MISGCALGDPTNFDIAILFITVNQEQISNGKILPKKHGHKIGSARNKLATRKTNFSGTTEELFLKMVYVIKKIAGENTADFLEESFRFYSIY